jgi:MerR family transcriptional regulator/heat shock protein HspR
MTAMRKDGSVLIGEISRRYAIHPQTLRMYEREGLIQPDRTEGKTRLYGPETIERLEIILTLTRDLGVNLAGVEVILNMKERLENLQQTADRLVDVLRKEADRHRPSDERFALVKVPGHGARKP